MLGDDAAKFDELLNVDPVAVKLFKLLHEFVSLDAEPKYVVDVALKPAFHRHFDAKIEECHKEHPVRDAKLVRLPALLF